MMTTQQKAEKYYKEMKTLARKITRHEGRVTMSDFNRLEQLFKIGGINKYNIKGLYENCGFNSWEEYLNAKKYCSPSMDSEVSCVDDQIMIAVRNIELTTRRKVYE